MKVSAFSTWDKELHKIVFDPRYLLLNPKERKQVQFLSFLSLLHILTFSQYCAVHWPFLKILHSFVIMSASGVWSVCEDASGGGEEGEEEQADAGQRRVQEDDGGGEAHS